MTKKEEEAEEEEKKKYAAEWGTHESIYRLRHLPNREKSPGSNSYIIVSVHQLIKTSKS